MDRAGPGTAPGNSRTLPTACKDGVLQGEGIVNDKGPMSAFMIACKALKESGVELRGDVIQAMVPGEIGYEPVDEYKGHNYISKETGARFALQHGPLPDFCVVAEGTDFAMAWIECGKAFFKVSIISPHEPFYTPYIPPRTTLDQSPNPIVQAARLIERIERYAKEYQARHTYRCPGGLCIPKVGINSIRGGQSYHIIQTPMVCNLYLDCRLNPHQDPLDIRQELEAILDELGIQGRVEQFVYRRGFEAKGIDQLVDSVTKAHQQIMTSAPKEPAPEVASMWRDLNLYNELGVPAMTYGPPRSMLKADKGGYTVEDLTRCAQIYALTAYDLCNKPRRSNPRS